MWFLLAFTVIFVLYFIFRRIYNLLRIGVSEVLSIQKPEIRKHSLIMSDCFSLSANYQVDINKNKLIIFVHDFFNSKADFKFYIDYFQKIGYNFLAFDLRYHHNEVANKKVTLGSNIKDLVTIINLFNNKYPHQQIYLLGQGLGANIISCLSNKAQVTGIILLNIISNPNYLDSDLKTKFISLYGFWFDRNVKLPVVLVEKLISKNKPYQLQIKKYFENKPFLLWYRLQMNSLINKSYWKLKSSNKKVLLLQSNNHPFGNQKKIKKLMWAHLLYFIDDAHDLLWSKNYEQYCKMIHQWIENSS